MQKRSPRVCRSELPSTARPPAQPSARPPSAFRAILSSHQIRFRRLLPPRCNSLLNVTAVFQMYFEIRETFPRSKRVNFSRTMISFAPKAQTPERLDATHQSKHFNLHSAGASTPSVLAFGTTANRSWGYRPCVSAITREVHAGGSSRVFADGVDATGDAAAPEADTVRPGVGTARV